MLLRAGYAMRGVRPSTTRLLVEIVERCPRPWYVVAADATPAGYCQVRAQRPGPPRSSRSSRTRSANSNFVRVGRPTSAYLRLTRSRYSRAVP